MALTDRKPYHRRTIDETCEVCSAEAGTPCTDLRSKTAERTKNLHRYQPVHESPERP